MQNTEEFNKIVSKARNGDEEAFGILYETYWPAVLFVCNKLVSNKEDAKDLLQDTFMKAFEGIRHLKSDDKVKQWLLKVAANECYQWLRKNKLITYADSELLEDMEETNEDFLPELYVQKKESCQVLIGIIDSLPQKQREATYLYYYAGMTTEEIAQLQNCSVGSVKHTLVRARGNIKSRIEANEENGMLPLEVGISLGTALMAWGEVCIQQTTDFAADAAFTAITAAMKAAKTATYFTGLVSAAAVICTAAVVAVAVNNVITSYEPYAAAVAVAEAIVIEEKQEQPPTPGQPVSQPISQPVSAENDRPEQEQYAPTIEYNSPESTQRTEPAEPGRGTITESRGTSEPAETTLARAGDFTPIAEAIPAPVGEAEAIPEQAPVSEAETPPGGAAIQTPSPSTNQLPASSANQLPAPPSNQLPTGPDNQLPLPPDNQLRPPSANQLPTPPPTQEPEPIPEPEPLGAIRVAPDISIAAASFPHLLNTHGGNLSNMLYALSGLQAYDSTGAPTTSWNYTITGEKDAPQAGDKIQIEFNLEHYHEVPPAVFTLWIVDVLVLN